jgi:hypothetical protein
MNADEAESISSVFICVHLWFLHLSGKLRFVKIRVYSCKFVELFYLKVQLARVLGGGMVGHVVKIARPGVRYLTVGGSIGDERTHRHFFEIKRVTIGPHILVLNVDEREA